MPPSPFRALPLLRAAALAAACTVAAGTTLAQGAMVTIVDGEAAMVDGIRRFAAAPGVKAPSATLIETSAGTGVVRLEWPDGSVADLGPGTRAMVQPPGFAPRGGRGPALYLLRGWAKVSGPGKEPGAGVLTPATEVLPFAGTAVVAAGKPDTAFAETGPLDVVERANARRIAVMAGAFYAGAGRVEPRPPAAWLGGVPRAFRDPLPRRAAALKDKASAGAPLPAPTYALLADWLQAEPGVRRDFPSRFNALAQDVAFRRELQAHLSAHPEWYPVLHPPEKKPETPRP